MGKHSKKQNKNTKGIILVVVLSIILVALLMVFVLPQLLYRVNGGEEVETAAPEAQTETAAPEQTETEAVAEPTEALTTLDPLTFPMTLENGSLSVDGVFPYSGINPDSEGQDVSDVAAITISNVSGQHLTQAVLTVTLLDGTTTTFSVAELPAQKSATVFSANNQPYNECAAISAEATFTDAPSPDDLSVSVEGLTVTVTNNSSEDLSEIDVYCRDIFGESYFGGIAYKHTISELNAGQTATIDVTDSIVGMIEVVRIATNE